VEFQGYEGMAQLIVEFGGNALAFIFLGGEKLGGEEAQPFCRFPQRLFSLLPLGDVGYGEAVTPPALGIPHIEDIEQHGPPLRLANEMKFFLHFLLVCGLFQKPTQDPAVRFSQETRKEAFQEFATFHTQQGGGGEVGFQDAACMVNGKIAHRGEVIEVGVFAAGFLQLGLGQPEFLVLHLQLDLVHAQFMDETGGLGRGELLRGNVLVLKSSRGQPAQALKFGVVRGVRTGLVLLREGITFLRRLLFLICFLLFHKKLW
jgi:hypothetical protein